MLLCSIVSSDHVANMWHCSFSLQPISLQYVEVFDVGEDDFPCAFCCVVSNMFKQHTALYTLQAESKESKASYRMHISQQLHTVALIPNSVEPLCSGYHMCKVASLLLAG